MQITQALSLTKGMTLSLVGAGGKTSLIFALAGELAARGQAVLVTTTTAMFHPDHGSPPKNRPCGRPYDRLVIDNIQGLCRTPAKAGEIVVAAKAHDPKTNKIKGYSPGDLTRVQEGRFFDHILIEADGSKRLPIKAPADHEPVIPDFTDMVIGCIGLDCLGRPMDGQTVHRPEIFSAIARLNPGDLIRTDHIISLTAAPRGLFKNTSKTMKKIVLLNKADTGKRVQTGRTLARRILNKCPEVNDCLVACLLDTRNPVQ